MFAMITFIIIILVIIFIYFKFRLLENKIGMRTEHRVRYNQSNYRR